MKKAAIDLVLNQPWCIEPGHLNRIIAIADSHGNSQEKIKPKKARQSSFEALNLYGYTPMPGARSLLTNENMAVLPIIGPIFRYANLFTEISGATSLELAMRDFELAENSSDIDTLLIWSDSPGGMATQIIEFSSMIRESALHTIGYAGDLAASATYWIISAADKIIASPSAMLGSIGAVGKFRKNLDDDDFIEVSSSQSPKKRMDIETESGKADAQGIVDDLAMVMIRDIANNRGVTEDHVIEHFGQGSVMIAQKAVEAGMADEVNSLKTALEVFTMGKEKTDMTVEDLRAQHPALYESLVAVAENELLAARAEGAEQERQRIQGVIANGLPGHEALVQQLAFDGKTTPEMAAVMILNAERQTRNETNIRLVGERPEPVATQEADDTIFASDDERAEREWARSPDLRGEFGENLDAYKSWLKLKAEGRLMRHAGR